MKTTYRHKLYAWCMTRLPNDFYVHEVLRSKYFECIFYMTERFLLIYEHFETNYLLVIQYKH